MYLCEEIRGPDHHNSSSHSSLPVPRLSSPFSFLPFLSVFPPILPSCSSYFSLLPGARRSVPDGNSLRLQEPPWRPHGGGTGGEQSGPVLPRYPSLSFSPSPMYFFLPFPLLFFFFFSFLFLPDSRFLSVCLLSIQPARLHRSSG